MMHDTHCAPLERGILDMSHSINMSILWIEGKGLRPESVTC